MHVTSKHVLLGAVVVAIGAGGYFGFRSKSDATAPPQHKPIQTVRTALAEKKAIPVTIYANGYIASINTVDIRPQIQNIVRTVHVREGQEVQAGQLLFTLDARSDSTNLDKTRAQLAHDRADLKDAEAVLKRNQELLAKDFVSPAVIDTARSKVDALRATVNADQAAIESSSIALGYNQIRASMSGRLGAISVHPGSLAQPAGTPMVTISQLDPIAVRFSVPERELPVILATYPKADAPVTAQLPNSRTATGKLIFIDNTSDVQSGTIQMKAQFANADRKMWPGTFVNVSLVSRVLPDAVVIASQAIVIGPADKFVYAVQADDTVQIQKINVLNIENEQAAVTGLNAGTRIVVEGSQNLRPGSKIKEMQNTQEHVPLPKNAAS